jgi:hypothetical protein
MAEEQVVDFEALFNQGQSVPDEEGSESNDMTIEDFTSIFDSNQAEPDEKPPLTISDYYERPSFLNRIGVTGVDTEHPIYKALMTDPSFANLDPSEKRDKFIQAVDDSNEKIYQQTGTAVEGDGKQAVIEGLGGEAMRTQVSKDAEGNKQTFIVPNPNAPNSKIINTIAGGGAQAIKGIARVGEGVTDKIGEITGGLIGTDPETDYVKENFPTVPPTNEYDAIGQEVISMLIGSVGGVGLASKLEKAYNLSPKMARYVAQNWSKVRNHLAPNVAKKPEEIIDAARIFSKTFILGTGANIGTTATTPQEAKPLFGDNIAEALGFDAEENRNIANFADNVAFSGGLMTLGKIAGITGKGVKALFKGTSGLTQAGIERDVGALVLSELDKNIIGAPAEIFAERASILGEVIRENSESFFPLLGNTTIPRTSVDAVRQGARDYVDRAYVWQKSLMGEEAYEKFADDLANTMSSKMIDLHRSRMTSQTVRDADAAVVEGFGNAMTNTAEGLGGADAVDAAASGLAGDIVMEATDKSFKAANAGNTVEAISSELDQFQNNNDVLGFFMDAARNNQLGSNAAERRALNSMSGPQLYEAWKKSFSTYKSAWDNLPTDVELPVEEFHKLTTSFVPPEEWPNFLKSITQTGTLSDPINKLIEKMTPRVAEAPNGDLVYESVEEMLARLDMQGVTMAEVFTDLRGQLALRADALYNNPLTSQQGEQLRNFVRGIDQIADNVGDPAFTEALDLYRKHDTTFRTTEPLRAFEDKAKIALRKEGQVATVTGLTPGMGDAYAAGKVALSSSMEGVDDYQKAFIAALQSGTDENVTAEMAKAYLGMSMNFMARNLEAGQAPRAVDMINALEPQLAVLENVAPDVVERFRVVVGDLKNLEAGLTDAETVAAKLTKEHSDFIASARTDAAAKFIDDLIPGKTPKITQEPQAAFNEIFGKVAGQGNTIDELMKRAAQSPDGDLIISGIQVGYLEFLRKKVFLSRKIALTEGNTTGAVNDVSSRQIQDLLNNPANPFRNSLDIIFKNNPERKTQFLHMLELQDISTGSRSIRGETFGSTTTYDKDLTKSIDRLITLRYGVLNTKATVTRNIVKTILKPTIDDIEDIAQETMDILVARPDQFDRMLKLVADGKDKKAMNLFGKMASFVSDQTPLALRGAYLGAESVDEQTEKAIPQ